MKYTRTEVDGPEYYPTIDDDFLGVTFTKTSSVKIVLPKISYIGLICYTIIDEGANASINHIYVESQGSDTISGNKNFSIETDLGSIRIYNNGLNEWFII